MHLVFEDNRVKKFAPGKKLWIAVFSLSARSDGLRSVFVVSFSILHHPNRAARTVTGAGRHPPAPFTVLGRTGLAQGVEGMGTLRYSPVQRVRPD